MLFEGFCINVNVEIAITVMFLGPKSYACFWDASNGSFEGSKEPPGKALGPAFGVKSGLNISAFFWWIFMSF